MLALTSLKRSIQFYRDFRIFTGGHLKVFHYFQHVLASESNIPCISFTADSIFDSSNPWCSLGPVHLAEQDSPDAFFLAGLDWRFLTITSGKRSPRPVFNLIQHPRHALPHDPRHKFLRNRAIRICVSEETRDALSSTGIVNGPLFVIPNSIDLAGLRSNTANLPKDVDLLIVANKQPEMGYELGRFFKDNFRYRTRLHLTQAPRSEFLSLLARSRVALFLPNPSEGFYLPALEGMAAGTFVVCPDCIGNRSFCLPGRNCFRPSYAAQEIKEAAILAQDVGESERNRILAAAQQTASMHDLPAERRAFLALLKDVDELW